MATKCDEQECDDCGQRPNADDAHSFEDCYLCDSCANKRIRQSAASGDLLAACERMIRDQDRPAFSMDFRGAIDDIRAAIRKAQGGEA